MSATKNDVGSEKNRANGNGNGLKGGLSGEDPRSSLKEAATRLAASTRPPELKLPPTKRPDMSALEFLDLQEQEASQRDQEIASRVGDWMENDSLPNLDKIEAKVKKLGDRVLQLVAGKNEKGENITFAQQRDEYRRLNEEYLSAAFPIGETDTGEPFLLPALETRKAAHMAVLKHRLRPEMERPQFVEVINLCVKDGYFQEGERGAIPVWQRRYNLSADEKFGKLGEAETRLVAEIVGRHVGRINSLYREDVQEEVEELRKQSEIELHQLLAGDAGKCFVHAPKEVRGNFKLSDVYLLVEGNGEGKAVILGAAGPDKNRALAIKEKKLFLWLPTLNIPRPPRIETLMDKGFTEEDSKSLQLFWGYLDRARRALEEKERREYEKELAANAKQQEEELWQEATEQAPILKAEYCREATVSLDRVLFEMEPMEGIFFGEFEGDWRNPDGSIVPNGMLFFQGEQRVVDGKPQIRVKKAPSHLLGGRFFKDANMEFASYEEAFAGLEQPLQGLMKALYRQTKSKVGV